MDQYSTEEQQIEALKRFWKEYGPAILLGGCLGFGGLFGWRYYHAELIAAQERTSDAFTRVTESLTDDSASIANAQTFIDDNSDTQYAVMMALQLAKQAVDKSDLEAAAIQLTWVVDSDANPIMKDIANLRLARVQAELQQFELALTTLTAVEAAAHKATVAEVRGDILRRQGKLAAARQAYAAALAESEDNSNNNLQMKLDDLASQG